MKLPKEDLAVHEQLAEFDQWLTAKLERIKDSQRFSSEIDSLCGCIKHLSGYLSDFSEPDNCSIDGLARAVIESSGEFARGESFADDEQSVSQFYHAFFNLLFLATGATDNNLKNHFLIKLKEDEISFQLPKRGVGNKIIKFKLVSLPPTTKSTYIARLLASYFVGSMAEHIDSVETEPTFSLQTYLDTYLREYISLILEDEEEVLQLWSICRSYIELSHKSSEIDFGRYLLNSCTIFKVRGSVSASGGHVTEDILRAKLAAMGLRAGIDYNVSDVKVGEQEVVEEGRRRKKTRAYDFMLPYQTDCWEPNPKLFIQSQFYAGDSGSVSHKVVDQTASSRQFTISKYPAARFVEYVDGAGYYAALRGDLEHMLTLDDTHSFIQVKSILVRLRREFQVISFITPVEFEHAVMATQGAAKRGVYEHLRSEGYPLREIERAESVSLDLGFISLDNEHYSISDERAEFSRKLFILDVAANAGRQISDTDRKSGMFILLPGFGANYGVLGSELCKLVSDQARSITVGLIEYEQDIEWLLKEKVIARM